MALNKTPGAIDAPINPVVTEVSNEGLVNSIGQLANSGINLFGTVRRGQMRREIDSLFDDVPAFSGEDVGESASARIGGEEAVTVSTGDSPFINRMVADLKNKRRAVDQGVRSEQWYKAQVDRIVAEYTDTAPGLARSFAEVGNRALGRNFSKEEVAARMAQEAAYEKWREEIQAEGDKHHIPRRLWETDPLQAMAKLEAKQNLEYKAANAANLLKVDESDDKLNALKAEQYAKQMMPHFQQEVTKMLKDQLGLVPGASAMAIAERLSTTGAADAQQLGIDWEAQKNTLFANLNANGKGITRQSFNSLMEGMDKQVEMARQFLNGEVSQEAIERTLAMSEAMSKYGLYDTPEKRRLMAGLEIMAKFPNTLPTSMDRMLNADAFSNFLSQTIGDGLPDLSRTTYRDPNGQQQSTADGVGAMVAGFSGTADMDLSKEHRAEIGTTMGDLFSELAIQGADRIHVKPFDTIVEAINHDEFWNSVDTLDPEHQSAIYNNINLVLKDRAAMSDLPVAAEFANERLTGGARGMISVPDGFSQVKDLIRVESGFPPRAVVRDEVPEGRARAAAAKYANEFNKGIAPRVKKQSEAYAKFLQRTGETDATPSTAYRRLYEGRIGAQYLKEDETPSLDAKGRQWVEQHTEQLQQVHGDRAAMARYVRENGAPDSVLDLIGG